MNENTLELAENKLLLLYIIKSIKYPISNTQLTEIVLENSFINYFLLQQYISELIASEFLKYEENDTKKLLRLTDKGDNVLYFFKDRISHQKISLIDDYISERIDIIKKELTITSDYTLDNNDTFLVNLKAVEDNTLLIDLKVNVASKKQAIALCTKWKENPSDIYNKIFQVLIND
ncbi:hypothetical protein CPJCM30710_13360 [Clostridium polyendosporum]|uniref:DUF4364 domain-containing protein n=1 Tax=Clostridium polyendosporum TaxID=69208 RepID=A0A919RY50_9CLOT|nr:DUF4364 family protein [Clostridium polyendosporum]GIM28670.1 hypothetical protein CPJCM30710_13360 [Clostridium polyendosporum]